VGSLGSPLPVELERFTGKELPAGIQLNWQIANQENITGFEIEKSADGISFVTMANAALNAEKKYSYLDAAATEGDKIFYRLKLNKTGLSYSYSKVLAFSVTAMDRMVDVYPNPVLEKELTIRLGKTVAAGDELTVVDVNGRIMQRVVLTSGQVATKLVVCNVDRLAPGSYVIKLAHHASNSISSVPFVKN